VTDNPNACRIPDCWGAEVLPDVQHEHVRDPAYPNWDHVAQLGDSVSPGEPDEAG
jgi:hypothetical protein